MKNRSTVPDAWSRIHLLMTDKSIPYASKLAKMIGIKNPITFYLIKNGTQRISLRLAEKFKAAFPDINSGWLLTGEGPMYVEAAFSVHGNLRTIPIYSPYGKDRRSVDYCIGYAPVVCDADLGVVCQPYFHGNGRIPHQSVIYLQNTDALLSGSQYIVTRQNEHYIGQVQSSGASAYYMLGDDGTRSPLLAVRDILDHFRIIGWTVKGN